jgi:DNA primase
MTQPALRRTRDEMLACVDLADLADELLGAPHGDGHRARWACPSPGHGPQTGRTPPVNIYTSRTGIARWRCHACGAGGTAIDLLMEANGLSVGDAFAEISKRTGEHPIPVRAHVPEHARRPGPEHASAWARHALNTYVAACEEQLHGPAGLVACDWLDARGLRGPVLRANRVGYDPGSNYLPRAKGLPWRAPAIVFPMFDAHGAVYLQARTLEPDVAEPRYENPAGWLLPNPRHTIVRTPETPQDPTACLYVCEGIPDALSIAQNGGRAVALLGTGVADHRTATWLRDQSPGTPLVLAFDADSPGARATRDLAERLNDLECNAVTELALPAGIGDINDWLVHDEPGLRTAIRTAAHATPAPAVEINLGGTELDL